MSVTDFKASHEQPSTALSERTFGKETGQERKIEHLGRKGADTRKRLINATRRLLDRGSPVGLTSSSISHEAGVSAATFYNYFRDIGEIIHVLCLEVSEDVGDILASLKPVDGVLDANGVACRFVDAYDAYWMRHRAVLSLRNMEADRGNAAFRHMRRAFVTTMMDALLEVALAVRTTPMRDAPDRLSARIAVVVAAVERLAAVNGLYEPATVYPSTPRDLLRNAQVSVLGSILDPGIIYESFRRASTDSGQA